MPNFKTRVAAGAEVVIWSDPETADKASRLFPATAAPHRRLRATKHVQVEVRATPDGGAEAPLDAAITPNTFLAWVAEYPGRPFQCPHVSWPAGQTSVQRFTPRLSGHYTFVMRRTDGGEVIMHIDVD